MTIIEFVPIKISPWSAIAKLLKKAVGTDNLDEKFKVIDKQFTKMDDKLNSIDIKFDQKIFSLKRETAEAETVELRAKIFNYKTRLESGITLDAEEEEEIYRVIDRYVEITNKFQIENSYCDDAIYAIRNSIRHPEIYVAPNIVGESVSANL